MCPELIHLRAGALLIVSFRPEQEPSMAMKNDAILSSEARFHPQHLLPQPPPPYCVF